MSAMVLLVGNQNAGKSTLFNALTGLNAKVANFPGITVEARIGEFSRLSGDVVRLVDIPGTYSLIPTSDDEELSVGAIFGTIPALRDHSLMVVVIDATELRRGLYLYSQIIELGHRAIIALSMVDMRPDLDKKAVLALKKAIGTHVVPFNAQDPLSIKNLKTTIDGVLAGALQPQIKEQPLLFKGLPERLLEKLGTTVVPQEMLPRHARKSEDLIKNYNIYLYALRQKNRVLSLSRSVEKLSLSDEEAAALDDLIGRIPEERFKRVDAMAKDFLAFNNLSRKRSDAVDKVLLQPVFGTAFLILTFVALLQGLFLLAKPLSDLLDDGMAALGEMAGSILPAGSLMRSLVMDGIFAGVGSVLTFLPLIAMLFLFLTVLEDSGYLARATFLLDATLKRFGLGGRSLVPMISGFACAVPAIIGARTIASHKERFITIMVTPLLTCSARAPVYALLVGAIFSSYPPLFGLLDVGALMFLTMYALGIGASLFAAWLLSKVLRSREGSGLAIELPVYRWPNPLSVAKRVTERMMAFLRDVASVILAATIIVWALFHFEPPSQYGAILPQAISSSDPAALEHSYAGLIGKKIEPALAHIGLDWRVGVGLVSSFLAREVFISTMAVVYGLQDQADEQGLKSSVKANISPLSGLCLLIFFTLSLQCASTLAAVRRETGSYLWPLLQFGVMTGFAYALCAAVYAVGSLWVA